MSLLYTVQYKQCLCILTFPKCNALFVDQICTNYRPEKKSAMVQTTNRIFHK